MFQHDFEPFSGHFKSNFAKSPSNLSGTNNYSLDLKQLVEITCNFFDNKQIVPCFNLSNEICSLQKSGFLIPHQWLQDKGKNYQILPIPIKNS